MIMYHLLYQRTIIYGFRNSSHVLLFIYPLQIVGLFPVGGNIVVVCFILNK